ncbi:MAG: HAD family hydrolase [Candidatus Eremiobacteraeota bacterium]|nr:HAD family hydrolase [Candidatus Eremiobacteraeota bacterium]MBV8339406.1 HAD family hydrolase [Candidatus Eremiobacteraeota bacterium]MBV8460082.1 HAD family hydrolase [Candidatus Eremiobacteraeota bacterium]
MVDMLSEATRGFLFDVDGTLVLSNQAHAASWSRAFAEFDMFDVPPTRVQPLIGLAGDDLITSLKPNLDEQRREQLKLAHQRIFMAHYLPRLQAARGARALLEDLQEDGRRVIAVSAARKNELSAVLDAVGLADVLQERISADDASHPKPSPAPLRAALARLSLRPAQALAVGDSPYDIIAAQGADVSIVVLRSGGWSAEHLVAADGIFDDPADLHNALFDGLAVRRPAREEASA